MSGRQTPAAGTPTSPDKCGAGTATPGGRSAQRRPGSRRTGRSRALLLPAIVLCLLGSISVRLAGGTGAALAQGVEKLIPAVAHGAPDTGGDAPRDGPDAAGACPADPAIAPILDRLASREAQLVAAEKTLGERQQTLAVAETRITARLADLKAAEEALARTMARTSVAAEDDLSKLTAVYETMKAKDAVPLFEAMAPEFAAGFLARMRPDAAAGIMAGMAPDKAYAVSVILAGRNATVPVPPDAAAAPAAATE